MGLFLRTASLSLLALMVFSTTAAYAQTERALERRADRNQRQLQRQANRAGYYTAQTWQQINPWIQQYGVATLDRAATANTRAGNAVRQTVDAATAVGDGQFGYRDKAPQQAWFYDYYTYSPTRYVPQANGDRYESAVRYFDNDGDGVYDSQSIYRDSDDDGSYDEYNRIDFYSQANVETESTDVKTQASVRAEDDEDRYVGPHDARRHKVSGEIALTKTAEVNGQENLLVGLKHDDDQTLAIDLGPAENLKGKHVEVGSKIEAIGPMQTVGEKDLLVADTVRIGEGSEIEIQRNVGQRYTGEIIDVKKIPIGSGENYMAVVDIDGEHQLVDLGPTTTYKVALKPSTKIVVQGIPVRSSDHRVLMADQVRLGDEVIHVKRVQNF